MIEPLTMALIAVIFVFAGTVKGIVGLGLPTISLGLLTTVVDLPSAMVLILVPSLLTNIWQSLAGGNPLKIIWRIWPFLLPATGLVWLGAMAITRIDWNHLSLLLGVLLILYGSIGLKGMRLCFTRRQEFWIAPALGSINGVLTGMTGSFVIPGAMYLQAIGLSRDTLVQALGILFSLSTLALALSLRGNDILDASLGMQSLAALLPTIIGVFIGQRVRAKISEKIFRRVFFVALLLLGIYIVARSILII
ncbi:sulfite exporter TauE/SafE family protein [Kiloniella antarctica]|uniref:Probable membrane transporter protein n=1 Tax=Kiloniella antarctica TaxID=1550907 RepID=A0ABW5BLR5_9PROT